MSRNRSTKSTIVSSLPETDATVTIARSVAEAIQRLEGSAVDAVVVDADTVDLPSAIEAVDRVRPDAPTFVHWNANGLRAIGGEATPEDALASRTADRALEALVDDVTLRVFDATSPGVIDRLVRETLVADDRFAFAWIGEYDCGEREIVPWVTETTAPEWSTNRTFGVGTGETPALERALRDRELQVLEDVTADRTVVPLEEDGGGAGVRSAAIAPLTSAEDVYGVLVVYGREGLGSAERAAIREIAAAVSRVLEFVAIRGRQSQLERTLHRYERLVETAGDGMYVLDERGHFITVNAAFVEMTGYGREGLLGEHASRLFGDDDVDAATNAIRGLLADADATTDTVELALEPEAGDPIPCEAQITLLERDGEFVGTVGVLRDVTERKRRERTLREQNERLDAFARIVSHDLRNPLSVSKGYLELLATTDGPEAEYVEYARESVERMETIVEDVLSIAREGEWASDVEPVDLSAAAETAWDHVSTADASLAIEGDRGWRIDADRSRLLRLLENLFRNAVEHGDATAVEVGALGSSADPRGFYVEDDGRGLPDGLRGRIFDPSVSTSSEGLGIGLWIVREVAVGHDWSVVSTEGTDGGARFEIEC